MRIIDPFITNSGAQCHKVAILRLAFFELNKTSPFSPKALAGHGIQ
jgi:hypothetical protein